MKQIYHKINMKAIIIAKINLTKWFQKMTINNNNGIFLKK